MRRYVVRDVVSMAALVVAVLSGSSSAQDCDIVILGGRGTTQRRDNCQDPDCSSYSPHGILLVDSSDRAAQAVVPGLPE